MKNLPFLFLGSKGFTLIETLIVLVILSISALAVAPRLTGFFSSERKNTSAATTLMVKTFDDAFIHGSTDFLLIHLAQPSDDDRPESMPEKIFSRRNALSVVQLSDGIFADHKKDILKPKQFPDSFRIEEVLYPGGNAVTSGNILVPFYPTGSSEDIIIHITMNGDHRISVRLRKYMKEPVVTEDFISFEEQV